MKNKLSIIAGLISLCITLPIWFYIMYFILEKLQATELVWFLYWAYIPAIVFSLTVEKFLKD